MKKTTKRVLGIIFFLTALTILASCGVPAVTDANPPATADTALKGEFNVRDAVLERFLRYVAIDTQSEHDSDTVPSTAKQLELARMLVDECNALGLTEVKMDEFGIVTATLPANTDADVPVLGLLAHMDTAPDFSGANVVAQVFENYDGNDLALSDSVVLKVDMFPELKNYIGQTIITASGDTLLGADDKSGIAIILTAMEYFIRHPEIERGKIRIAFTVDEETGSGIEFFDVESFGVDFGFTVDGGPIGELEYENFNAAFASFNIIGISTHPGSAKDVMVNAVLLAAEIIDAFPADERPATTEGHEGFYHVDSITGDVSFASLHLLIRDHDEDMFASRKAFVAGLADVFNEKYGEGTVSVEIVDTYYNMLKMIPSDIIEFAKAAFIEAGVEPLIVPIRGGTDGARLSYLGLPCPNIFAGGHNFHGPYEFIPLESMEKSVEVIINMGNLLLR